MALVCSRYFMRSLKAIFFSTLFKPMQETLKRGDYCLRFYVNWMFVSDKNNNTGKFVCQLSLRILFSWDL